MAIGLRPIMRRRRGRPRNPVPNVPTSVALPAPVFDAACRLARREDVKLHRLLKDAITAYVRSHEQFS